MAVIFRMGMIRSLNVISTQPAIKGNDCWKVDFAPGSFQLNRVGGAALQLSACDPLSASFSCLREEKCHRTNPRPMNRHQARAEINGYGRSPERAEC